MVLFDNNTKINILSESVTDDNNYTNIFTINEEEELCYYQGQMKDNKWDGYGKLWTKYFKYHGNFKNGKVNGHGIYEHIDNNDDLSSELVKYYEGNFIDGNKNGIGKEIYLNNESYFGSFNNSLRNGNGTLYNSNGTEKIKCFWENGSAINTTEITEHWENGNIKYKGGFNGIKWHGKGVICYKNGNIFFEGNLCNDKIENGIIKLPDNRKIIEGTFLDGNYTIYHKNGTRYLESYNSEFKEYTDNGLLYYKGTLYNDPLDLFNILNCRIFINDDNKIPQQIEIKEFIKYKKGTIYFSNTSINENKVKYILEYNENNIIHGSYKEFNNNSLLIKCCTYLNGEYNGHYTEFYENGRPKIECSLNKGKYVGELKEFFNDENSNISTKGIYVQNQNDPSATLLTNAQIFYPSGKKKFEGTILNKKYHDAGKIYYDNDSNSILYDGNFLNGKYENQGSLYYENGNNKYTGNWLNSRLNGQGTSFYETGSIEYFGDWVNDEKHGQGNLFNEAGEQVWSGNFHYNEIQMPNDDSSE